VDSGYILQDVQTAAAAHQRFFPLSLASEGSCQIGGNIATNAGGLNVLRYGTMRDLVLGLEVVLPNGDLLNHLMPLHKNTTGYETRHLFIGSEGMFAAVTEVVLKLLPKPQTAQVIQASFADMGEAGRAVADIIAEGIIPAGLEMMDGASTRAVDDYLHAGFDREAEALLLCESDGMAEEVEAEIGKIRHILSRAGATGLKVSRNEIERTAIWADQKSSRYL